MQEFLDKIACSIHFAPINRVVENQWNISYFQTLLKIKIENVSHSRLVLIHTLDIKMLAFRVCFILYFLKFLAGIGLR